MKNILLLLFLINISLAKSQNRKYTYTDVSLISPKKDTLWIINDDLGRLIAFSWESKYYEPEKKPVILLVDRLPLMEEKNKRRYIEGN